MTVTLIVILAMALSAGPGPVRGGRAVLRRRFGWAVRTLLGRCGWIPRDPALWRSAESDPGAAEPASGRGASPEILLNGTSIVAVLDVLPTTPGRRVSATAVDALSALLSNGGVVVESIRWLQTAAPGNGSRRSSPDGADGGERTVRGHRSRVVLVLRIDACASDLAIRARGGGDVGARRVVAVTVSRTASLLAPSGLRPRLVDPSAAARLVSSLDGAGPGRGGLGAASVAGPVHQERRHSVRHAGRWHRLLELRGPSALLDLLPGGLDATERDPGPIPPRIGTHPHVDPVARRTARPRTRRHRAVERRQPGDAGCARGGRPSAAGG